MSDFLVPLLDWMARHPYWLGSGILLIALLECLPPVGILWPGTVLMFSAALLAGQGELPLWPLVMLAWLGAMCSHCFSYLLGIRLQAGTRNLRLLRTHPEWMMRAELHLANHGVTSLFLGHFIGPVRPLLSLLAGMLRMSVLPFFLTSLCASGIWAMTVVIPGWLAGAALDNSPPDGFWQQAAILGAGALLLIMAAFLLRKSHPQQRQLWMAGLSAMLLLILLTIWPEFSAFDLYLQQQILLLSAPFLDGILLIMTLLGDIRLHLVLSAILCTLLLWQRTYGALLFAFVTLTAATALNALLKTWVARPRPELLPQIPDGYSMPSGHSLRAFAFCLVITTLIGLSRRQQLRPGLLLLICAPAALTALSRVYLTAHWPTDVLASLLLAICCCTGTLAFTGNRLAGNLPGKHFWQLLGGLSLLAVLLHVAWFFADTASRYNLLQGLAT